MKAKPMQMEIKCKNSSQQPTATDNWNSKRERQSEKGKTLFATFHFPLLDHVDVFSVSFEFFYRKDARLGEHNARLKWKKLSELNGTLPRPKSPVRALTVMDFIKSKFGVPRGGESDENHVGRRSLIQLVPGFGGGKKLSKT
jgi:hypothetical protein